MANDKTPAADTPPPAPPPGVIQLTPEQLSEYIAQGVQKVLAAMPAPQAPPPAPVLQATRQGAAFDKLTGATDDPRGVIVMGDGLTLCDKDGVPVVFNYEDARELICDPPQLEQVAKQYTRRILTPQEAAAAAPPVKKRRLRGQAQPKA